MGDVMFRERINFILWPIALLVLILISHYNYLLFHNIIELFSIVIAGGIFMFAWNANKFIGNKYFLFIGIAYFYIAFIDFFHAMAYQNMGVFTGFDSNLPTQLWIIARYLEAVCLLVAPFYLKRKLNIILSPVG
jgi:hypothetical protein